jgi:uncharacterized protein DUF1549
MYALQSPKALGDVIAQITQWINAGVPYDQPLTMSVSSERILSQTHGSNHWAFQPPKRPAIPRVKNQAWVRNPIDAFVAAERGRRGLTPLRSTEKRLLLRRVYLDLIGLPPTPEETRAFLADSSLRAYKSIVDRLLSSGLLRRALGPALDGYLAL